MNLENTFSIVMKKLFKLLNTISPITIVCYVARPVLALALKGDKFTDPIDGKVLNRSCLMATDKETTSYHQALFH
jgi:hypothetical protein